RYLYRTYLERADVVKDYILDPSAGDGRWGISLAKATRRWESLVGVDIDRQWGMDVGEVQDFYTDWRTADFLDSDLRLGGFDVIVSNPPYSPIVRGHKKIAALFHANGWPSLMLKQVTLSELFIRRGWDMLNPGGYMMYLLPLQFLAGMD